jgi:hypothetical protein
MDSFAEFHMSADCMLIENAEYYPLKCLELLE